MYTTKKEWREIAKTQLQQLARSPIRQLVKRLGSDKTSLPSALRLYQDKAITVLFGPFSMDRVSREVKVIIIGLTPGRQQMIEALKAFEASIVEGLSFSTLMTEKVAFCGPMRTNLITSLDAVGVHRKLGIKSTSELFGAKKELLGSTSLLRYPTFKANGENFSGSASVGKIPFIRSMIHEVTLPWLLKRNPNALIVPLGKFVNAELEKFAEKNPGLRDRCLFGFPHPSGSNNGRRKQILQDRGAEFAAVLRKWTRLSRD